MKETLKCYTKTDGKWILTDEFDDDDSYAYIHNSLESILLGKYLLGYKDTKKITQVNNLDGTRTISAYSKWDTKLVYTIKA